MPIKGPDQSCSVCDSDEKHEFGDRQRFECKECEEEIEWRQILHECPLCGGDVRRVGPMVP